MSDGEWTEIRATSGWFRGLDLREVAAFREVARALVLREFKSRYKQAVIGVAWAIVQPVAGVVLFTLIFGELAGLPSEGLPYAVFVFAGLIVWNYFNTATGQAGGSLVDDPELVTKVYFPRILAPAAALVPPLLDAAVGLLALGVLMAAYGEGPGPQLVLLPLFAVAAAVLALGVGALFAALHVRFRDVGHATGLLMQLWFFATPIIYPASEVDGIGRVLLALNPMTPIAEAFRWSIVDAGGPEVVDLLGVATGVALFVIGISTFQRLERRFADVI